MRLLAAVSVTLDYRQLTHEHPNGYMHPVHDCVNGYMLCQMGAPGSKDDWLQNRAPGEVAIRTFEEFVANPCGKCVAKRNKAAAA